MSRSPDQRITNMDGHAALPRANGELVFPAPWEGRAFALAVPVNDARRYPCPDCLRHPVASTAAAR